MYKAELPAGWAAEIARDYQRRAAKPPAEDEIAEEREAVLGRLRRDWGDATDAKLAQVRELVRGIGDDRLTETLDRSGLGNNEWLIRQLAIHADRKAAKAAEQGETTAGEEANSRGDSDTGNVGDTPYRVIADRSGEGVQVAESTPGGREGTDNPQARRSSPKAREVVVGGRKDGQLPYADIPLEGGYVPPEHVDPRRPEKLAVPRLNFGEDRQKSIIENTPSHFDIADNVNVDATKPEYRINNPLDANKPPISNEEHNDHEVDRYESIIDEEAKRQGVDPNLVKAIMYMETTHGGRYGHLAEGYGLSNSILPMNIGIEPWKSLGFTEADFNNPRMNIRAGVTLLKRIIERVANPTVAKVATLYNNIRREKVNDYGARVAEIYRQQLWRIPKKPK